MKERKRKDEGGKRRRRGEGTMERRDMMEAMERGRMHLQSGGGGEGKRQWRGGI